MESQECSWLEGSRESWLLPPPSSIHLHPQLQGLSDKEEFHIKGDNSVSQHREHGFVCSKGAVKMNIQEILLGAY